jgi:hypothetical protein
VWLGCVPCAGLSARLRGIPTIHVASNLPEPGILPLQPHQIPSTGIGQVPTQTKHEPPKSMTCTGICTAVHKRPSSLPEETASTYCIVWIPHTLPYRSRQLQLIAAMSRTRSRYIGISHTAKRLKHPTSTLNTTWEIRWNSNCRRWNKNRVYLGVLDTLSGEGPSANCIVTTAKP